MDTELKRAGVFGDRSAGVLGISRRVGAFVAPILALAGLFLGGRAVVFGQDQTAVPPAAGQPPDMPPGYPSLNAPWTAGRPHKTAKAKPADQTPPPAAPAAAATPAAPPAEAGTETPSAGEMPPPPPQPRIRKNEVSASGDYFLGQGYVTLPFGFGLANKLNSLMPGLDLQGTVNKADRTSDYFGGTVSYSYGQAWYLDLTYAHGSSSGTVPVSISSSPAYEQLPSSFSINDDWYQAYIRYAFPGLRGKRLSAYLRAGVSYVQARLTDGAPIPVFGIYSEEDKTDDLLGNLGFGVGYLLYARSHLRVGLQVEGEGFYGHRSQNITESFPNDFGLLLPSVKIDNDLYGAIGRGTVRAEYRLGHTGAFKLFGDGGIQAKFAMINYPGGLGSFDELLWGPYVKVGLRYSF